MLFSLKFSSYFSDTELSDLHDINMEGRINKIMIKGSEQWCTCQNCQSMPSAIENQCCQQNSICAKLGGDACITESEKFKKLCFDVDFLEVVLCAINDRPGEKAPKNITNR